MAPISNDEAPKVRARSPSAGITTLKPAMATNRVAQSTSSWIERGDRAAGVFVTPLCLFPGDYAAVLTVDPRRG